MAATAASPSAGAATTDPAAQVARFATPLFIASGTADKMVPAAQSIAFHQRLTAARPDLDVRLVLVEGMGHDFAFWGLQTEAVLAFFAAHATPAATSSSPLTTSPEQAPPEPEPQAPEVVEPHP